MKEKLGWGGRQPRLLGTGLRWVATARSACSSGAVNIAPGGMV